MSVTPYPRVGREAREAHAGRQVDLRGHVVVHGRPVDATAVVFDCDGTLVDTEPLAWDAWRHVLRPAGIEVTPDDVAICTGTSFESTYHHFTRRGRLPDIDALRADRDADLLGQIAGHAAPFPDAVAACRWLAGHGLSVAVASSSPRRRLELTLTTAGLRPYPQVVVSRDDVDHGKPHPDLFLLAADQLGVPPGDCLAVEDAGPGVESARRAGMTVMAVWRGTGPCPEALRGADVVASRIAIPR